jgi:hypothetical protein
MANLEFQADDRAQGAALFSYSESEGLICINRQSACMERIGRVKREASALQSFKQNKDDVLRQDPFPSAKDC